MIISEGSIKQLLKNIVYFENAILLITEEVLRIIEKIGILSRIIENRRLLQDRGILSRIFETAATARLQVGVMLVHER